MGNRPEDWTPLTENPHREYRSDGSGPYSKELPSFAPADVNEFYQGLIDGARVARARARHVRVRSFGGARSSRARRSQTSSAENHSIGTPWSSFIVSSELTQQTNSDTRRHHPRARASVLRGSVDSSSTDHDRHRDALTTSGPRRGRPTLGRPRASRRERSEERFEGQRVRLLRPPSHEARERGSRSRPRRAEHDDEVIFPSYVFLLAFLPLVTGVVALLATIPCPRRRAHGGELRLLRVVGLPFHRADGALDTHRLPLWKARRGSRAGSPVRRRVRPGQSRPVWAFSSTSTSSRRV